ncbi:uncharacterized protein LOC128879086 isoform X2 [Hylaeus volcanicus]|uniref:uncharacterized protein LOC128879086 isoform X2 n=1 Tax=Hylaeus volcanicus TaxID=313075 RepID=UPI0023B84F93|nr:uncharacterized protein LOC128879086 isoform X2 [Hylaeus volcanicus]
MRIRTPPTVHACSACPAGGIRLRHPLASRKRRNAQRPTCSFTTTCSSRKHRPSSPSTCRAASYRVERNHSTSNRMRSHTTSGVPLTVCVSACLLMVLLFASGTTYAKRGCSAFGHSCFGGHGKRFDPHVRNNALQENEATTSDKSQELGTMRLNEFALPMRKFEGQGEVLLPQSRRQDPSRFDPYTLSFIVGQWLTSHRRLHQPDPELDNK